ncbi:MAG: hypothetical protein HC800_08875 [Phormidesmis sp. RL_2_1]|nr:hypothetical protein [Phormidesmis sp. RL_2_1]
MSKIKPAPRQVWILSVVSACLVTSLSAGAILSAGVVIARPQAAAANSIPVSATPAPGLTTAGMTFEQAMNVGYAASRQGDFHTALINFQRALMLRPGHPYATAAAENMAYYIAYDRVFARQQTIAQLESRLASAISQKDWVCAATTLDTLTTYAEPNSLNQERLIGQRGEVSGLLDARIDHEFWSTVCSAQRPVH